MRIQIFSDLHLEFKGNPFPYISPDADIVVLAGDLAPIRTQRIGEIMRTWNWPDVLYIPGNHEYYGCEIDAGRLELARQCRNHGIALLDCTTLDLEGIRFIGATLWTDFKLDTTPLAEAWAHHEVAQSLPDFKGAIRHYGGPKGLFTTQESARRHAAHRAFIERELARAEEDDATAVVITHHAPSPACVRPWYRESKINAGFASNLDEVIERYHPPLVDPRPHARLSRRNDREDAYPRQPARVQPHRGGRLQPRPGDRDRAKMSTEHRGKESPDAVEKAQMHSPEELERIFHDRERWKMLPAREELAQMSPMSARALPTSSCCSTTHAPQPSAATTQSKTSTG